MPHLDEKQPNKSKSNNVASDADKTAFEAKEPSAFKGFFVYPLDQYLQRRLLGRNH